MCTDKNKEIADRIKKLLHDHAQLRDDIFTVLCKHGTPILEGEQMLCLIAGLSAGMRGGSLKDELAEAMAVGWLIGAKEGDE